MPLIHPISSVSPLRPAQKTDMGSQQSALPHGATAAAKLDENETGKKAVEPAAPPSALQLQIKALISEQSQDQQHPNGQASEAPS
ncbi:hypothetical protein [Marivita hallyeonensis]|uniref:Uncharacterized protein n=1 Tax=Marivita hallyeonensis TaxID=996342 RepID=A0A1M5Y0C7_9RHOB|nr:hypothetical protein [Marivita hallyeonensis]SHI05284.1 hypothetical protein SAMN05443551_4249 [Marivita hallyeonensis]